MPRKPVGNTFLERRRSEHSRLFDQSIGQLLPVDRRRKDLQEFYRHPGGSLSLGDCLAWLEQLPPHSVDLIFADPPYNIGKANWDEFESQDAYVEWSLEWIGLAARALKPRGSLYICGFSEILADLRRPAARFFPRCRWLVWFYKNKANLSKDWGRSHESILHLRQRAGFIFNVDDVRIPYGNHTLKYPEHPQATSSQYAHGSRRGDAWTPHPHGAKAKDVFEIPVTSNGMGEKTPHPTQKPEELLRKIILASSNPGDVVADPFVGSGTTVVCAQQLQRRWIGCDISGEYLDWAVVRLEDVPNRTVEEWLAIDRQTASRREAIR